MAKKTGPILVEKVPKARWKPMMRPRAAVPKRDACMTSMNARYRPVAAYATAHTTTPASLRSVRLAIATRAIRSRRGGSQCSASVGEPIDDIEADE